MFSEGILSESTIHLKDRVVSLARRGRFSSRVRPRVRPRGTTQGYDADAGARSGRSRAP